ncbi:MAG TPA: S1C family serine protease [Labilithrix sp.]
MEPQVPTNTSADQPAPLCSVGAVASLDAVRQAKSAGPDLASIAFAERAILVESKKPRPDALARALADVEKDAETRLAAADRYRTAVAADAIAAERAAGELSGTCHFAKIFAGLKPAKGKKSIIDPKAASAQKLACERYEQLAKGVRWDDAKSLGSFADDVDGMTALPQARTNAVATARTLAKSLGAAAADHDAALAPNTAAEKAERALVAMLGSCDPPSTSMPLVVAKDASPRSLTVVVLAKPPEELAQQFEAAAVGQRQERAQLFLGVASGRLGSGFFVVTGGPNDRETFIVTNRHVVDLAANVSVRLEDGALVPMDVAFIDSSYDLAVLTPKDAKKKLAENGGFALATRPPQDGEAVVASGFPGLMGQPSFQVTQGNVSNGKLVLQDVKALPHVQHTAAIDPGSSGGPLLGASREVLGVNTFKLVGRENVNFAVPASAVANAIASAREATKCDDACRARALEDSCLGLVSELARPEPRTAVLQRMIGQDLVAAAGIESHDWIIRYDPEIAQRFTHSPVATLSESVVRRLAYDVQQDGGVHPLETCAVARKQAASLGKKDVVQTDIMLGDGALRTVTLRWQTSRWLLADFPFDADDLPQPEAPAAPAPKKPAAPAKKAKK